MRLSMLAVALLARSPAIFSHLQQTHLFVLFCLFTCHVPRGGACPFPPCRASERARRRLQWLNGCGRQRTPQMPSQSRQHAASPVLMVRGRRGLLCTAGGRQRLTQVHDLLCVFAANAVSAHGVFEEYLRRNVPVRATCAASVQLPAAR